MRGIGYWKHGGYGGTGFLNRNYTGRYRPRAVCKAREIDCPERNEKVDFSACVVCEKFQVWHEQDGEHRTCYHDYLDLKSRGHYDGTWNEHKENFDPETFAQIQESKRLNEEISRKMESEREELEDKAKELERKFSPYFYSEYSWIDEEEEAEDQADDDEEEEYF